jgi:hypothetical protein
MNPIAYAQTAFSSHKPRDLPPPADTSRYSKAIRWWRSEQLPWGIHFGDFRNLVSRSDRKELRTDHWMQPIEDAKFWRLCVQTSLNPKVFWKNMEANFLWLAMAVLFGFGVIWLSAKKLDAVTGDPIILALFVAPFTIYLFAKFKGRAVPYQAEKNVYFNRCTGMATFPNKENKPPVDIPFDEFDGYLYQFFQAQSGTTDYHLHIGHRYSPRGITVATFGNPAAVYQHWEFFQQFMDVSKPIPDIPQYEPYRHLDPTTAAYDQKHKRIPSFWQSQDDDTIVRIRDEVDDQVKAFDWNSIPYEGPYDAHRSPAGVASPRPGRKRLVPG